VRVEFAGCHVPDDPGHRRARQRSLAGDAKGPAPVEAGDNQQVITVKWKLYTRDEDRRPPVVGPEIKQHDLKTDALEEAWQLMYGPTRQPHTKVLYIEGPNGERIEAGEIEAWCKDRAARH